ncbi:hypothetical protein GS884_07640 [Rhodococcus hoagii]|nr:hypothetical protein [Prescottella equi]
MTESGGGIARTTGVVAVATVASRATGFLRTVALAAVLGTAAVGDAYNGATACRTWSTNCCSAAY